MPPAVLASRKAEADVLLSFAMACATIQHRAGRLFYFEHPQTASSWGEPAVVSVRGLPGVFPVDVHQCRFGLKSPRGEPIRKATRLLTNSHEIYARVARKLCVCQVPHRRIEGNQDGHRLSVWAQRYPIDMCKALAEAAVAEAA